MYSVVSVLSLEEIDKLCMRVLRFSGDKGLKKGDVAWQSHLWSCFPYLNSNIKMGL